MLVVNDAVDLLGDSRVLTCRNYAVGTGVTFEQTHAERVTAEDLAASHVLPLLVEDPNLADSVPRIAITSS